MNNDGEKTNMSDLFSSQLPIELRQIVSELIGFLVESEREIREKGSVDTDRSSE